MIIFIVGLFFFFEKYPDFVRNEKSSGLIRFVDAEVLSIKAIEGMSQSAGFGAPQTVFVVKNNLYL